MIRSDSMTAPAKEPGSGTIIRGADGTLYFIRDEILAACKITEPECLEACSEVLETQPEVSGYTFASQPLANNVHVNGPLATPNSSLSSSPLVRAASTVMCPWSIGKNFGGQVSNPAIRG